MKKFFLYFALTAFTAFTTTNAQAQDRKLVNMTGYNWYSNTWGQLPDGSWGYTPVKLDEPTLYDNYYYYYNSQNQLAIETTYTQLRYIYNDNGTKASKETWNFSNGIFCCTMAEIYEYDEEGNIILATTNYYNADGEITNSNPVEYSGYINGYYTIMKTPYYENHFEYVFNDVWPPTQPMRRKATNGTTSPVPPNTLTMPTAPLTHAMSPPMPMARTTKLNGDTLIQRSILRSYHRT